MDLQLKDRVALVTGSGQGLGLEIAKRLADQGARVVISDLVEERVTQAVNELTELGYKAQGLPFNVANSNEVNEAVKKIVENFGKIDILVNNAGINRDNFLTKMSDSDWEKVIQTNLTSVFYCTRAVANYMREVGYGKIVNISSIVIDGNLGIANYAASKAGIVGFTRSIALELAPKGINVNAVAPGFFGTDMLFNLKEEIRQKIVNAVPMGRTGKPSEVADLVAFLASDRASYINGALIRIDGGMSLGFM
ncbi:MAG: 3-oxoacyl-ACP reductase FabG [Desulfitobacteriaceae bacterium]